MQLKPGGGGRVDEAETSIAMRLVGKGWVGWIRDVNAEQRMTDVVLVLIGLGLE